MTRRSADGRLRWHEVLRALREARGVTQDGWGARLAVSRATIQRWESGERVPDPSAEAAIVTYCAEQGLLRTYDRGPLAGLSLTAASLQTLFEEARLAGGGREAKAAIPSTGPELPRANLPASITSFVGREGEIAALRRVQAGTRLLTLTGAGGCGKTRLAIELAGELLWAYPHGVWLAELAALADPALVSETVAAAVGVHANGQQPLTEALVHVLKPRHLLLILDNCEHLLQASAELVETLLRACPHLEVLTTSREPLGISGETIWRVPPMALPPERQWATEAVADAPSALAGMGNRRSRACRDGQSGGADAALAPASAPFAPERLLEYAAVRLFRERAAAVQPGFALTAENAAAIVEICRQLDGIPLAIELAAARVRVLPPERIAERLSDRFRLLTGGSRTALPRQQTLRAAMDWSYDLLSAAEQASLRRLSVFAGGVGLDAAEAVCGPDVLDLMTALVDKSLVIAEERDGAPRYRLLETVRQYAGETLAQAGEAEAARDRHLDWCLALMQSAQSEARGPCEPRALAELEREHDNLRAALGWSLTSEKTATALRLGADLARFWELHGHLHEGRQWLARALAVGAGAHAELRAKALHAAGSLAYMQGDFATAHALEEQGLVLYRELGDRHGIAEAQGNLGSIALRQGAPDEGRRLLEASLALYAELEYKPGLASVQSALGSLTLRQGDYVAARTHLEASLCLQREIGNRDGIAHALEDLATVAGEQGDGQRQAALVEESLAVFRELGSTDGIALALGSLGMVAWVREEHDRALALLEESLALYEEVGDRRGTARSLANQSLVALSQSDHPRAEALCRESMALYLDVGDTWAIGRYLPILAATALAQGQPHRAARLFGAAAVVRERLSTPLPPLVQPAHDRAVAAVRAVLGEDRFAPAWAEGEAMSAELAVDYALSADEPG